MPALGAACGRRGPSSTVLGRPAPDTEAHCSLGPVSQSPHPALSNAQRQSAPQERMDSPSSTMRLVIPDIRS
jgi:hypothetical protein